MATIESQSQPQSKGIKKSTVYYWGILIFGVIGYFVGNNIGYGKTSGKLLGVLTGVILWILAFSFAHRISSGDWYLYPPAPPVIDHSKD